MLEMVASYPYEEDCSAAKGFLVGVHVAFKHIPQKVQHALTNLDLICLYIWETCVKHSLKRVNQNEMRSLSCLVCNLLLSTPGTREVSGCREALESPLQHGYEVSDPPPPPAKKKGKKELISLWLLFKPPPKQVYPQNTPMCLLVGG